MNQLERDDDRAATLSSTTKSTPSASLKRGPGAASHPFNRFSRQPSSASSASILDSNRFARSLRPTLSSTVLTSSAGPPTSARGAGGASGWRGRNAVGYSGAVSHRRLMLVSDKPTAAPDSSPEMVLRATAASAPAAAASGFSSDDAYEFGGSFLFGAVGQEGRDGDGDADASNSATKVAVGGDGASAGGEFGLAAPDRGDDAGSGLRSRFFGELCRTSNEPSGAPRAGDGAAGSGGGADEDGESARGGTGRGGAASTVPGARKPPSPAEVSSRAGPTKHASSPSKGGTTKPFLAPPLGRAAGGSAGSQDVVIGSGGPAVFHRPSRGSAGVGGAAGAVDRSASGPRLAGWAGESGFGGEDGHEGGDGGSWSFEGSTWSNGDGDDGDDGGDIGGGGKTQLKGARVQPLHPRPGVDRHCLKGEEEERSAVAAPDATGRGSFSAVEQHATLLVDADGGSLVDRGAGDDGEDDAGEDGGHGGCGSFSLPDEETDALESQAKTAQRQQWLQRKDAAMTKFRRDCEVEVERIRIAVEDHVRDMEDMLDEELIQALDGAIAEKIEDNHREKARARKIESLMSAFFCDPRIPKAQRVA
eukprot:g4337.t1